MDKACWRRFLLLALTLMLGSVALNALPAATWAATTASTTDRSVPFSAPRPQSGVNLLANPSFDAGVHGWTAWNGQVSQANRGRRGSNAARVDYAEPLDGMDPGIYRLDNWPGDVHDPQVGSTYTASAWAKGEDSSLGKLVWLVIRVHDGAGNQVESAGRAVVLRRNWQQLTVAHTVAAGMAHLDVYVAQRGAAAGDHFYADDLALYAQ